VKPCGITGGYQNFGGTYLLHIQGRGKSNWEVGQLYTEGYDGGYVARMEDTRNAHLIFVGKLLGKQPFGRPRR
jgi:hypothetical protein